MKAAAIQLTRIIDEISRVVGMVAVWLVLWMLYMSIVNVGQTFYSFGWETMLLVLRLMIGSPRLAAR